MSEKSAEVYRFTSTYIGITCVHPQKDPKLWPAPIGQNVGKPSVNCLRRTFSNVLKEGQSEITRDYEHILNYYMLHNCRNGYCLRTRERKQVCRFGFPIDYHGYEPVYHGSKNSVLWEVRKLRKEDVTESIVNSKAAPLGASYLNDKFIHARNHQFLPEHVPEISTIWRANCNIELTPNYDQIMQYLMKYCLKPEEKSVTLDIVVKDLLEKYPGCETRKAYQKFLLKTVTERNVSVNEAVMILARLCRVLPTFPPC